MLLFSANIFLVKLDSMLSDPALDRSDDCSSVSRVTQTSKTALETFLLENLDAEI